MIDHYDFGDSMRFSMSLNGSVPVTASLRGQGYLNAHLNMANRTKENDQSKKIRAVANETQEKETVYMKWPELDLKIGDVLEIRILSDGEGDPPSSRKSSSQPQGNLFSSSANAKELIEAVSDFEGRLFRLLDRTKETESAEDYQ